MNFSRSNPRKGPAPLEAPPPGPAAPQMHNAAQAAEQHRLEALRQERARRAARKPTDRNIPDELAAVTVGDGVRRYEQLRDAERRLDALMMRKRLDVKDNGQRPHSRREGTLRIWISNTAEGQPWQEDGTGLNDDGTFDFDNDNNSATYRVKIEGKLLDTPESGRTDDDGGDDVDEEDKIGSTLPRPKFSSFFKEITVDYHRNPALHPDGFSQIGWRKQQSSHQGPVDLNSKENSFDSLEFQRKSDENINVTINLTRDHPRERCRLSQPLRELLDTEEDDMPGVVQGIWEYARAMNLQEDDDKRTITCDEPLQRIFNQPKIGFPFLPDLLQKHLQPLPPVKLEYTIRVDKAYISPSDSSTPPSQPTVYDILVPLPSKILPVVQKFKNSKTHIESLQTIVDMDDSLALLVAKINETNSKRKFYDNLSKDPARFVNRWVGSQKRDLEVILAEATRGGGEDGEYWRRPGESAVWDSTVAKESVGLWLARSGKF